MKRKQELRRTEWKRAAKPSKRKLRAAIGAGKPRKALPKVAKKTAERKRRNKPNNHCGEMHDQNRGKPCWWCGMRPGCRVHHIAHKPIHDMVDHRTGLFWTCDPCHTERLHGDVSILECFEKRRLFPGWDEEIARSLYHARMGQVDWLGAA